MKWAVLLVFIAKTLTCPITEPTTIQIQNYDGPIFLHIPAQNDETCPQSCPTYQQTEIECTCIAKPSIKYIPINTASESSCYNRKNCGTCTCGPPNNGKHCGTCTCRNNSENNGGACTCVGYDDGKHCRTCTCGTNNSKSCTCGTNNSGSCTCGTNNSGSCTCGNNNSGSCTCGTNSSASCTCGRDNRGSCNCGANNRGCCTCGKCTCGTNNGGTQFCNEDGYKGIDKVSYTLDIVKPRSYDSGCNSCICHKYPGYY